MTTLSLQIRMARLERHNRILLTLVGALLLTALIAAASRTGPSRATSFQLIDDAGKLRAELAIKDGAVGLYLLDGEGRSRLEAVHEADATRLFIQDDQGTTRIGVSQFAHGGGGFALHGPDSKGAAVLYLQGEGSLRFFDEEGKVTHQVLATPP
jgi:hypothetical protein